MTHWTNCMLACLRILSLSTFVSLTNLCLRWLGKSFSLSLVWRCLCNLLKAVERDGNLRLSAQTVHMESTLMLKTHHWLQWTIIAFFISHKENGKPRRDGRESGDYCSHHPGEVELKATSRHKYSNIWLWCVWAHRLHLWWWVFIDF